MWNQWNTGDYAGMIAETISLRGWHGDAIRAYHARPLTPGPHPGLVLIPHIPGWDEWQRECARRFAEHGYEVVCPDIYARVGTGRPADIAAQSMAEGGRPDEQVMGDTAAALDFLHLSPTGNGKVGVIGMCSGGRHAYLAACSVDGFDACVDCWGGGVVQAPEQLSEKQPVSPADLTENLSCPVLGIFGNDDRRPDVAEVNALEARLKAAGKEYEFLRYDGAGHGIWYYDRPVYRQEQAMDSWNKCIQWLDAHLK